VKYSKGANNHELTETLNVAIEKSAGKLERMDPISFSETCIFFKFGFDEFDPTVLDHNNSDKYSNSLL
jgi:hypothetical protein